VPVYILDEIHGRVRTDIIDLTPEPVPALGTLDPSMLPESEPACVGLQTARTMLNADWPALFAALSFLLTKDHYNLRLEISSALCSQPRSGVPCAPQAARSVPHRARKSRPPTTRRSDKPPQAQQAARSASHRRSHAWPRR